MNSRKFNVCWILALATSLSLQAGQNKAPEKPLDAEALLKTIKPPKDFTATIYACPPEVGYPTCLVCAPNGDVYIGIDENGSLGHDADRGRIVRCVDTNNDGKADKVELFAKIDSPRGLVHTGDKLFCLNPPFLTVFKIKPDGSAGESEVLVKGMGGGRTHPRGADHTTNGIQIGIDGWIYIAAGDFGFFKAVDKSGKELEFHGGGVARVRQDGTGLEIVSQGQRNIYDVAISPLMELFTRDNTNDGDGWDVRLSHVIPGGNYGYPRLYKSFGDEMIQPLADYGGGSPCGSLYIDEPAFPDNMHGLYTCEWGRSNINFHPLEPNGASYKAQQQVWMEIPRATDMEVDSQGHIYVASWRNGSFSFSGVNVGFVARLTYNNAKTEPFVDFGKLSDADLLKHIASPSHYIRMHTQHEILRRGAKPEFVEGLEKLATADGALQVRVAAMYTLKQLQGAKANDALTKLAAIPAMKEHAIKALADHKEDGKDVPTKLFVDSLSDANARVRLQAASALWRLERKDAAEAMIPLLSDADPIVSHIAFRGLSGMQCGQECLNALDKTQTNSAGVLRTLMYIHDPKVVDGLIERLNKAQDPVVKQGILRALCRLYNKEAPWDGSWWGTRPDSSGPYFKTATWDSSEKILATLKSALASSDAATAGKLAIELQKNKIDSPEAMAVLLKSAAQDPAVKASVVAMMSNRKEVPADALGLLEGIATSDKEEPALRLKAFNALQKINGAPAQDSVIKTLLSFSAGEKPIGELVRARDDFARDGKRVGQVGYFAKLAESDHAQTRELAFNILLQIPANKQAKKDQKEAVQKIIDATWSKPSAASLLKAIGQARAEGFNEKVKEKLKDGNAEVASAATYAAKQLKIDTGGAAGPAKPMLGTMKYEQVLATALKEHGDPKVGQELFSRQKCVVCHTLSKNEPPKGPFLGDIATRYQRAELIESVVTPNAKIAQGFESLLFKLKDGRRITGFVSKEAGDEVEVRDGSGQVFNLSKNDIEKRTKVETSIMPTGVVDNLTMEEFCSLLDFLQTLK